jgi:hypothetical protein
MLPAVLDERSKELLREFGTINGTTEIRPAASAAPGARVGESRTGEPGTV